MTTDQKPDGWVAFREREVDLRLVLNRDYDGSEIGEQDAIDIITRAWAAGSGELSDGWRVRPVRFQFLDEEKIHSVVKKYFPKEPELCEAFRAGFVAARRHLFNDRSVEDEFQAWLKERKVCPPK